MTDLTGWPGVLMRAGSLAVACLSPIALAAAEESCIASVYSERFSRPLADGRRHHPDEMLAAHRHLPLNSLVRVVVAGTGRSIALPIRDRGPFVRGRCIDLSRGAARRLGVAGLARVTVEPIANH